jgi:hypothetical protein
MTQATSMLAGTYAAVGTIMAEPPVAASAPFGQAPLKPPQDPRERSS